jgi:hypothetical protein
MGKLVNCQSYPAPPNAKGLGAPEKKRDHPKMVPCAEATGIEPAISGLTGRRDNQLR